MKYLILLYLCLISPAWAISQTPDKGTLIHLSATSSMSLPNDEAVIFYRVEAIGPYAERLRQSVNQISQNIHQALKTEAELQQQTLNRRMEMLWRYDTQTRKQVRNGWKLIQYEQITTHQLRRISNWLGKIEKSGAHLEQLKFQVADTSLQTAQQSLRLQTIKKFRAKAALFARSLDAKSFHIISLQNHQQQPVYPMRQANAEMGLMSSKAASPPSLEAGTGKISITISGQIALPLISYPTQQ